MISLRDRRAAEVIRLLCKRKRPNMGKGTGGETRVKLRINVQKQQENKSEFPEQEAGFVVQW